MRTWTRFIPVGLPVVVPGAAHAPRPHAAPPLRPSDNDNRIPAGVRHGDTLVLRLLAQRSQPSVPAVAVGQTFDFEVTPGPGVYELRADFVALPGAPPPGPRGRWRQRLVVR
jgi:hypothetical protein